MMVCAGIGLAPFRGFVQDRAIKQSASNSPADFMPAVLIVGFHDSKIEKLHATELDEWDNQGAVRVYYAYSRASDQSDGCKYAQDWLWRERKEIAGLFNDGAKVFICESSALGKGVGETACKIRMEAGKEKGQALDLEEARKWWEGLSGKIYAVDVFD